MSETNKTNKSKKTKTNKSKKINDANNTNKLGIFIFRRDLRFEDNRGLNRISEQCDEILPIFIFDSAQVDLNNNTKNYISFPALRFICEGVKNLDDRIRKISVQNESKLFVFYGNPLKVLEYVIGQIKKVSDYKQKEIVLGFNADYTSYSLVRDKQIENYCAQNQIELVVNHDDYVLTKMENMLRDPETNTPYKQYGAFKKNILKHKKDFLKPIYKKFNWAKKSLNTIFDKKILTSDEIDDFWEGHLDKSYEPVEIGTRNFGLDIINNLNKFKTYNTNRDTLAYNTTRISAYLNFGIVSEREFYWGLISKLGENTQLVSQIFWREYYLCMLRYCDGANLYNKSIDSRYDKLKWINKVPSTNSSVWKEWKAMMSSQTGFLLVDACIRELVLTGYMHNRGRLIVGAFATKYLGINPLCRYVGLNDWFSRHLVDCITSQNKLNAQWITELDFPGKKFAPSNAPIAGRPMNISNTMIKKWDPTCAYIKKWLPHLANIDNKILIGWDTKYDTNIHPKPIFDPKQRYAEWIKLCTGIK